MSTPTPPPVVNAPDPAVVAVLAEVLFTLGYPALTRAACDDIATAQATALAQAQDPAREALRLLLARPYGYDGLWLMASEVRRALDDPELALACERDRAAALASRDTGKVTT